MNTLNKSIAISAALSDLFFNHTHEKFDVVVCDSKSEHLSMEQAIIEDAQQFVKDYRSVVVFTTIDDEIMAANLAADFLERL